jgi:hypothetical protein
MRKEYEDISFEAEIRSFVSNEGERAEALGSWELGVHTDELRS